VAFFKRGRQIAPLLLAIWLIAYGVSGFVAIPYAGPILSILAIAAGVLILLDR
jgi:hypothetical protein